MSAPAAPARRLPPWLRIRPPSGERYEAVKRQMGDGVLHTVCEEARCPNVAECWGGGTATFMVLGDECTRGCRFCSVATARLPAPPDPAEPGRLAESLARLGLTYAVVTTVCRDDLPDQGAAHLAACIRAARERCPELLLEFLIQDFRGDESLVETVCGAGAHVLAHNLETVERLTPTVRDTKAGYGLSLGVLAALKRLAPGVKTKSSLMLGLGETEGELFKAFRDLRAAGVDILTLGQYLRPTGQGHHLPVAEFITPERFEALGTAARAEGFMYVASGPFVRSSYRAGELFLEGMLRAK
ncbi:MAG: lipoyl synthase [Elusimicrobia bacterium]|nr:lipoyl synthase [Elusimicrobiota bacterium]